MDSKGLRLTRELLVQVIGLPIPPACLYKSHYAKDLSKQERKTAMPAPADAWLFTGGRQPRMHRLTGRRQARYQTGLPKGGLMRRARASKLCFTDLPWKIRKAKFGGSGPPHQAALRQACLIASLAASCEPMHPRLPSPSEEPGVCWCWHSCFPLLL